ncbi:MAG TPA: hypothetical protein GXX14_12415 [Clostridiaceae bacterium]|nr:hypothetical protein [Clostridiaceae bacterium]
MEKILLNGIWQCKLPHNQIIDVTVPGCWDTYTPLKNIATAVVFTRNIMIKKQHGKRYFLVFGGVSYYCDVFVNGIKAGSHEGMWDRFRFDVTDSIVDGNNVITLEIIKPGYESNDPFPVREVLSGFIPDVLCTFGGIWDDVWLEICDTCVIISHYAKGDMKGQGQLKISVDFFRECNAGITVDIYSPEGEKAWYMSIPPAKVEAGQKNFVLDFSVNDVLLWDIWQPNLYRYVATIDCDGIKETAEGQFGFREISYDGPKLLLNGTPIYVRGVLHWGYYDEMIIPNPSRDVIQDEINKCRQFGFNMIKHCLYIPREEYFELADQNGILLWIELPLWLPDVTPRLSERIRREYPAILEQISGHPSIIFLSLGCELDDKVEGGILEEMYHLVKNNFNALVRDNSGSGECYGGLAIDFADFFDYHFYGDLQNMENLMENFTPAWRSYRPWLYGEFCDSDTMRDLKKVKEQRGVEKVFWEEGDAARNPVCRLKPDFYLDKHDERMEKSGIRSEYELIRKLSINHSAVHRKTTLEYTRAFPEICGYNITSIRDVPIATSGIFDDNMNPKFDESIFKQTNSDIVLAPAWDLTRVWINGDRVMNKERYNFFGGDYYGLHVILSNYSRHKLKNPQLEWKLVCGDTVKAEGKIDSKKVFETGDVKEVGYISINLPAVEKPETFILNAVMTCDGCRVENSWPVFIYPNPGRIPHKIGVYDPANIFDGLDDIFDTIPLEDGSPIEEVSCVVASYLAPHIKEYVKKGGKVFYVQRGKGSLPAESVAFWREGIIRRYEHPVVDGIKYEHWLDDLRFFSLSTDTAFDTETISKMDFDLVKPVIRRYDCRKWTVSDYMIEISLGNGTVIASTLRFEGNMGKQPLGIKNNNFGLWLLNSALRYLISGEGENG